MSVSMVQLLMFIIALLSTIGALLCMFEHDWIGFGICVAIVLINILGILTIKENTDGK